MIRDPVMKQKGHVSFWVRIWCDLPPVVNRSAAKQPTRVQTVSRISMVVVMNNPVNCLLGCSNVFLKIRCFSLAQCPVSQQENHVTSIPRYTCELSYARFLPSHESSFVFSLVQEKPGNCFGWLLLQWQKCDCENT